jgi:Prokaryotic membrane lipoprotein lipid attachment site
MKRSIPLLFIAAFLAGCNLLTPGSGSNSPVAATFALTDTLGLPATRFRSGDNFYMTFFMKNITADTLWYYSSFNALSFRIMKGDSLVASSINEYAIPNVLIRSFLGPGDTLTAKWKAPSAPPRVPQLILAPGEYEAHVSYPTFTQSQGGGLPPIQFSIVQ